MVASLPNLRWLNISTNSTSTALERKKKAQSMSTDHFLPVLFFLVVGARHLPSLGCRLWMSSPFTNTSLWIVQDFILVSNLPHDLHTNHIQNGNQGTFHTC